MVLDMTGIKDHPMEKEKTLSDEITRCSLCGGKNFQPFIRVEDIKQSIKRLKEEWKKTYDAAVDEGSVDSGAYFLLDELKEKIDKIFGDKLI